MNFYGQLSDKIKGKRVAIFGLGVSNLPLAKLLVELGSAASVTVYDKKSLSELSEGTGELAAQGVNFVVGFDSVDADVIFRSPGIRPDIPAISAAVSKGALLTSEMEEFLSLTQAHTFAVTGSDGKTTTTTLCGLFLDAEGKKTFVGGNIGTPLLDKCGCMSDNDCAVLELSSFQLMHISKAPEISAITNLSPNHMDWHTNEDEYASAKHNIVGENTRRVVLNADCEHTLEYGRTLCQNSNKEIIFFSSHITEPENFALSLGATTKLIYENDGEIFISDGQKSQLLLKTEYIKLKGRHNVENYMCAMGITYGCVSPDTYKKTAESFYGVEHRLQLIRVLDGVEYYNSSIDSSPTRTAAALCALHGRDIVIICGGYDKNLSYAPLASSLCKSARTVVLTGATAPKIKQALLDCPDYVGVPKIVDAEDFESAVSLASGEARMGGCVLLSPASASFDRFKNFAERGKYFTELVQKL